jgi:hypothetical protein
MLLPVTLESQLQGAQLDSVCRMNRALQMQLHCSASKGVAPTAVSAADHGVSCMPEGMWMFLLVAHKHHFLLGTQCGSEHGIATPH